MLLVCVVTDATGLVPAFNGDRRGCAKAAARSGEPSIFVGTLIKNELLPIHVL